MEDKRPVGARQARDLVRVAFGPSLVALVVITAVTGTSRATMAAPAPAPATVPRLHPAWNLGN